MKLLHLTDTHLGIRRYVRGAPPGYQRAQDHERAMRVALAPALRGEVDVVVHSGDVFDRSRPPQAAIQAADRMLREVARAVPTYVIPGNHDRRGVCRTLPVGAPGLTVCDVPTRVRLGDVVLALVPYRRTPESWRVAAEQAVGGGADWLVAHQAFDGHQVPGLTFRSGVQADTLRGADVPAGVTHVLCGHIHPRQVVTTDAVTVVTPGSTERTAFSEAEQTKGYAVWDTDATVPWQWHDLPTRPMVRVRSEADLSQVTPEALVQTPASLLDPVVARGGWAVVSGPRIGRGRTAQPCAQLSLLAS